MDTVVENTCQAGTSNILSNEHIAMKILTTMAGLSIILCILVIYTVITAFICYCRGFQIVKRNTLKEQATMTWEDDPDDTDIGSECYDDIIDSDEPVDIDSDDGVPRNVSVIRRRRKRKY